jgi:hypothetical protein
LHAKGEPTMFSEVFNMLLAKILKSFEFDDEKKKANEKE